MNKQGNLLIRSLNKYRCLPTAAKATIWFIVCNTLQKGISLLTTPLFTRIMTTEQYGQFNVYNSWLQIITIITTLRLNYAVFNKGMSKYKNDRDCYTATMQGVTLLLAIIAFSIFAVFNKAIAAFIELPFFIILTMFLELSVSPAISFWTLRKRYEYEYIPVVIVTLLMTLINAGIGVIAVLFSQEKGYARILSCVLVNTVFGMILYIYNKRKAGKNWFKKEYVYFALSFNAPLLIHYFSIYVLDQFDRIMIQKMVSISATALYGVAYSAGLIIKIITQSINSALVPWQYSMLEKRNIKTVDDCLFVVFCFVAGCVLAFSAFAPEVMNILGGSQYYEARYVIAPVALSTFFTFAYTTFANVEFYYDLNKFTMYVSVVGALLNIILNYFGIIFMGYIAAAYTTLICYVLFTYAHYFYMQYSLKKRIGKDYTFNSRRFIALSTIVLLIGTITIYLYDHIIFRYGFILLILSFFFIKRNKIYEMLAIFKHRGASFNDTQ